MSRRNDELESMLREMWEQGSSKAKIAHALNIDISTVRRRLRKMGVDEKMGNVRRIKPGSKELDGARKMREAGLSYEKIARKLGVSATTARAALLGNYSQHLGGETVQEPQTAQEPKQISINEIDKADQQSKDFMHELFDKIRVASEENAEAEDMVNHPSHYTYGEYECIDKMRIMLGLQAVIDYCKCAVIKYDYRCGHKGSDEDAAQDQKKMFWYLRKAEELEGLKQKGECKA